MSIKQFALAAAAALACASGQELRTPSMLVDFNGASGGFKLFTLTNAEARSDVFWNVNYKSLYEVDSSGTKVRGVSARPTATPVGWGESCPWVVPRSHFAHTSRRVPPDSRPQFPNLNLALGDLDAHVFMKHTLFVEAADIPNPAVPNATLHVVNNTMKVSFNV